MIPRVWSLSSFPAAQTLREEGATGKTSRRRFGLWAAGKGRKGKPSLYPQRSAWERGGQRKEGREQEGGEGEGEERERNRDKRRGERESKEKRGEEGGRGGGEGRDGEKEVRMEGAKAMVHQRIKE